MAAKLHDTDTLEEVHEINVTPFIDVILVLLIIFMVAAPLATVDIPLDLPASQAEPQQRPPRPVFVSLKGDLSLFIGGASVSRDGLKAALDDATGSNRDERIFVRADRSVAYGDLMAAMDALRAAGYLRLALVGLDKGGQ